MLIQNKYDFGSMVYLITDGQSEEWMVCEIKITPNNTIMYCISKNAVNTWVYEFELTKEKVIS